MPVGVRGLLPDHGVHRSFCCSIPGWVPVVGIPIPHVLRVWLTDEAQHATMELTAKKNSRLSRTTWTARVRPSTCAAKQRTSEVALFFRLLLQQTRTVDSSHGVTSCDIFPNVHTSFLSVAISLIVECQSEHAIPAGGRRNKIRRSRRSGTSCGHVLCRCVIALPTTVICIPRYLIRCVSCVRSLMISTLCCMGPSAVLPWFRIRLPESSLFVSIIPIACARVNMGLRRSWYQLTQILRTLTPHVAQVCRAYSRRGSGVLIGWGGVQDIVAGRGGSASPDNKLAVDQLA